MIVPDRHGRESPESHRTGSTMVEIDGGSHAIALSAPQRVSAVILDALASVAATGKA